MAKFLVELHVSRTDARAVEPDAERVRLAVEQQTRSGAPVRRLRSVCFLHFDACSVDAVRASVRLAGLPSEHVAAAESRP